MAFKNEIETQQNIPQMRKHLLQEQWKTTHNKLPGKIAIPSPKGYIFISASEILYCHSQSNYTEFYLTNKTKIISSYTLGLYEDILNDLNFFRVHRSCMINLEYLKIYKKENGGSVVMSDGYEVKISRSNKMNFMKLFKENL